MFQHIVYSLANRQGLFAYVRTCKTRLDTTTKFMVVVTSLFNLVISSFPDNMYYHAWTWLLVYHDGSNNIVHYKSVRSSSHEQSVPTCMNKPVNNTVYFKLANSTMFKLANSTMFKLASSTMFNHIQPCSAQLCSQACQLAKTSCAFLCVGGAR